MIAPVMAPTITGKPLMVAIRPLEVGIVGT